MIESDLSTGRDRARLHLLHAIQHARSAVAELEPDDEEVRAEIEHGVTRLMRSLEAVRAGVDQAPPRIVLEGSERTLAVREAAASMEGAMAALNDVVDNWWRGDRTALDVDWAAWRTVYREVPEIRDQLLTAFEEEAA